MKNCLRLVVLLLTMCLLLSGAAADGHLSTDGAYVSSLREVSRSTGIGLFDADDNPGNDSSADNDIVRTFDTVLYTLEYEIEPYNPEDGDSVSYKTARIGFAFKLPHDSSQVSFVPEAMTWIDSTENYTYSIQEQNGEQILYCYRYLEPNDENGSVIPGVGQVTVVFQVKNMKNGDKIAPEFYAWMEHNDVCDENGEVDFSSVCKEHESAEVKKLAADEITVSAKMKLNVEISTYGGTAYATYDFDTGNDADSPSPAAHKNIGQVTGTATYMGVNVAMHNDTATKGLLGLEYPDVSKPITFDIHLDAYYQVDKTTYPIAGETDDGVEYDFSPLLYSYGLFQRGVSTRQDGRSGAYRDSSNQVEGLRNSSNKEYACYNGGTWKVIQDGDVLHVTISDYQIDGVFPTHKDSGKDVAIANNIGYISSGALTLLFPHYNVQAGGENGNVEDYLASILGSGTFVTKVREGNLCATSVSEDVLPKPTDTAPGVSNQMVQNDDTRNAGFYLTTPGSYDTVIQFLRVGGSNQNHPWTTGCFYNGRDWGFPGSPIEIIAGIWYADYKADPTNQIIGFDNFIKIDADAFEFAAGSDGQVGHRDSFDIEKSSEDSCSILYAVLESGENWTDDEQMRNASQESEELIWFDKLSTASAQGKVVGLLYQQRGTISIGSLYPRIYLKAVIRDDAEVDETFMMTSTMRIWNKKSLNKLYNDNGLVIDSIPLRTTTDAGYAVDSATLQAYTGALCYHRSTATAAYQRLIYQEDGSYTGDTPTTHRYGDTMYIAPYETTVDIGIANNNKSGADGSQYVFDLDIGQNVVDYVVKPNMRLGVDFAEATGETAYTSVTMSMTIPEGLTYIPGSVYWGGTYEPTKHGSQGTIQNGLHIADGQKTDYAFIYQDAAGQTHTVQIPMTLSVGENADGTTTLQLVFDNVPLMDSTRTANALASELHFSAVIDSESGGQSQWTLEAEAQIQGKHEHRDITLNNGNKDVQDIIARRLSSEAISSVTDPYYREINALCDWTVTYNNNADTPREDALLFTRLPDPAVYEYEFTQWALDMDKAGLTEKHADSVTLYYTTANASGKDASSYTEDGLKKADSGWKTLELMVEEKDGKKLLVPKNIAEAKEAKAWVLAGLLSGTSSYVVNHGVTPEGSEAGEIYQSVSSFRTQAGNALATYASVCIVGRTISGLAWYDKDQDGVRDEGEAAISGAEVALYRKDESGAYVQLTQDMQGNAFGTNGMLTTDPSGAYAFTRLPSGEYAVAFGGDALEAYSGETIWQADAADESTDSDVDQGTIGSAGVFMTKPDTELDTIEDINEGKVALKNNQQMREHLDAGFIKNGKLDVTKTAKNAPAGNTDEFDFTLTLTLDDAAVTKDLPYTKENANPSKGTLTASDGKYTFKLQAGQTISIDGVPADAKYTVAEADATAKGYVTASTNSQGTVGFNQTKTAEFTNTYVNEKKLTLGGEKKLTGREFKEGDEFSFTLTADSGTPMPSTPTLTINPTSDNAYAFTFADITYALADAGKTYTYTICETIPEEEERIPGVTYSNAKYTVTVSVAFDAENNELVVTATDNAKALNFTNTYAATGSVTFAGTKTLTGRNLTEADVFTFSVSDDTDNWTATNDSTGKIAYPTINYDLDDVGTHTYTVKETSEDGNGITVDTNTYTVTVKVTDNGDGTLKAEATENAKALNFTNTYAATGSVTFAGTKTLTGRNLTEADVFTFSVSDDTNNWTATNDSTGKIAYPTINYDLDDVGTHTYTVKETSEDGNGITVDTNTYTVTVKVTDNGDGTLKAEATENAKALNFTNTYAATGSVTFAGTKTLTGRNLTEADVFTFSVSDDTNNWTATNDSTGKIAYPTINYDLDDVGTHTYTVKETSTNGNGVTVDTTEYTVKVTVSDNGDGTLKAEASENAKALNFTNTYEAEGSIILEGVKSLVGRAPKENEAFTFSVQESGVEVAAGTAVFDGTTSESDIAFEEIIYTLEDVGTHSYEVVEIPAQGDSLGVAYDETSYTVTVEVSDNGDGMLTAEATYDDGQLAFVNVYDATGIVPLLGEKQLQGRDFRAGDSFTFAIFALDGAVLPVDEEGNDVTSVTITPQDGSITEIDFGTLAFTLADAGKTYTYELMEQKGALEHMTYDTAKRTLTVQIADNGDGTLDAQMDGELLWTNVYDEPDEPEFPATDVTIRKVWDDGNDPNRPDKVTVVLGRVEEPEFSRTRVLSAENNWQTTFYGIHANCTYTVKEINVDEAYVSSVEKTGDVFTVTNTLKPQASLPDTGDHSSMRGALALLGISLLGMLIFRRRTTVSR